MNEPISSGDPQAAEKLTARIAELEQLQARMKEANAIVRKFKSNVLAGRVALVGKGFTFEQAVKLFEPDYAGRVGFAGYELTNNSGNIRRLKERLKEIQAHADDKTSEEEINGCTITDNVEDNRVQIEFPSKPGADVREYLKRGGFKWAPSGGVWQRYRGGHAMYVARQAAGMIVAIKPPESPAEFLHYHVTGAIERGEGEAIVEIPASVQEARAGLIPSEETDALPTRTIWDEGAERCTEPMLICPPPVKPSDIVPAFENALNDAGYMTFHGVALSDGPEDSLPLGPR